jgi:hypothetical protein
MGEIMGSVGEILVTAAVYSVPFFAVGLLAGLANFIFPKRGSRRGK